MQMNRIVLPLYRVHSILEWYCIFHFFCFTSSVPVPTEGTIFPSITFPVFPEANTQQDLTKEGRRDCVASRKSQ